MAIINGTAGRDTLNGTSGNDSIYGLAGADRILTGDGSDLVEGGEGDDEINGSLTDAATGRYTFFSNSGAKTISGGAGADFIHGSTGADRLQGDEGSDFLVGDTGNDTMLGGAGQDTLHGDDGADSLDGGLGDDSILGGRGNDLIVGGDGVDRILPGEGVDTTRGGDGNDQINGFLQSDGSWIFYTSSGSQFSDGQAGDDFVYGGTASDTLLGGIGNDFLHGDAGADSLSAGEGQDTLYGGTGNDTLDGGGGVDELYGGLGDDTYLISNIAQMIRDDGGSDTAIVSVDFAKIPNHIEKVIYAAGIQALPYWIDALLPDDAAGRRYLHLIGADKSVAYAFPSVRPAYVTDADDVRGWSGFSAVQQSRARDALAYISSIVDLSFVQKTTAEASNTILFANNDQTGSAGYAQYPGESLSAFDLYLDNSGNTENAQLADGTYAALTLIHELGHVLGLEHPFAGAGAGSAGDASDAPHLGAAEDSTAWTVMSYNDSRAQYQIQFSALDIAALHYLYGPSRTARSGADTYMIRSDAPNFIWDGGGVDTLSAENAPVGCTVYLTPGWWGHVGASKATSITAAGQVTVNFGTTLENVVGSRHADTLVGNGAANSITGGTGSDTIDGGAGQDWALYGSGRSTATLARTTDGWTVQDTSGDRDTLKSIERLRFSDSAVALDLGPQDPAGQALLLIGAVLGRDLMLSKRPLMGTVIDLFDQGFNMQQLAGALMRLPIWAGVLTATDSSTDIARYLLTRVQGSEPATAELSAAARSLEVDPQGTLLASLAASAANLVQVNLAGIAAQGFDYPLGP